MKIKLQAPPDYTSLVPPDVSGQQQPASSGMDLDNLPPEAANSIPDEGKGTVHYRVHHRRSEKRIAPDGKTTEHHSVRMHVTHFEPHYPESEEGEHEEKPKAKSKKLQKDAQEAVREHFAS